MTYETMRHFLRRMTAITAALLIGLTGGAVAPAGAIIAAKNATGIEAASSARVRLGDMVCTGAVISPWYILLAKHCVGQGSDSEISIGANHFGEQHYAQSVIMHPTRDLALVKLDRPTAAPAAGLSPVHMHRGMQGTAVGWGGASHNIFLPVQAAHVTVQRRVTNVPGPNRQAVVVETWVDGGRIQRGDSGGPLFRNGQIVGVASMSNAGQGHTVAGSICWYLPIAEELDWIHRHSDVPVPTPIGAPEPVIDATAFPTIAPTDPTPFTGFDPLDAFLDAVPSFRSLAAFSSSGS